ncbi:hypothetical protein CC86DRAFT_368739 [Ophiobolus disseminans]|uniref:Rab-GAP TBC domain-containing protein n=1 Tax=Ophiobolus disseminans TaxID=1469910 RepID=A0A6A7A760_9PLEO|nr:hypothetical protein CC86DRAFT_368739 [Ophiobolus disseminans]
MVDTVARNGTTEAALKGGSTLYPEPALSSPAPFAPYRPTDFTPPASPQPQLPHVAKRGFGSGRSKHPAHLQTDTADAPAHDSRTHSSAPSNSPPLPPIGLPSPKFSQRQRAPSLLRHAAVPPSPFHLSNGYPRSDQSAASPTMGPAMAQQGSLPGSPDLRAIYNPLASNPVHSTGPDWDSSNEDVSHPISPQRTRGFTSSSQPGFQPNPPLRSVTSIPDYGQFRGNDRANLSGTYKPNRGVPNWSHTDYYPPPPRQFRGEEPRASFRSGWTNASSNLIETSGTERSSIVTARSSVVSERQASIYSRDQSRDRLRDRDDSPETIQTSEAPEEEYNMDAVDDVIDSYYYDEDDNNDTRAPLSSSPTTLDLEPPGLSQTPSRDMSSLSSFHSSDRLRDWDEQPNSRLQDPLDSNTEHLVPTKTPSVEHPLSASTHSEATDIFDGDAANVGLAERKESQTKRLPPLQIKSNQAQSKPHKSENIMNEPNQQQVAALQRSSEELPRRMSISVQAVAFGASSSKPRLNQTHHIRPRPTSRNVNHSQMTTIQRDISKLPQLPTNKARLSRHDWAEIQAYSKRHSKRPSASRTISNDSISKDNLAGLQSPPLKKSEPLPELDENETIPRRASTSVYDRKSALFNLGMLASAAPMSAKTTTGRPPPAFSSSQRFPGASPQVRKATSPVERDRYGFKKVSDKINVQQYNTWATKYEEHISRRRNKWIALMSKQGLPTTDPTKFPEMCEKVKRYARKGYPPEWRGAMWWYYSGGQHTLAQKEMVGLYKTLVARVKQDELNKDDKDAIERDLDRTFPDNIHFRPEPATDLLDGESTDEPQLIQDLREVLSCFALNNPSIGYCQSLNFIAGLLLLFLKQDKEKAFVMLTIITQNHLPGAHARSLANTEVNVLMMLIKDYLPKVWVSINDTDLINSGAGSNAHPDSKFQRQPTVALSCTSWFMSIFVGVLPIETVLRVWDSFLYEGPRALYRYALAIFKLSEPEIRKYKPIDPEIFMIVQNLPRTCLDPNILHDHAFVKKGFGNLSQSVIDQKRLFWRDQNRIAHQTSVRSNRGNKPQSQQNDETDNDSTKRAMNGLRRRASRKFRKMRI